MAWTFRLDNCVLPEKEKQNMVKAGAFSLETVGIRATDAEKKEQKKNKQRSKIKLKIIVFALNR